MQNNECEFCFLRLQTDWPVLHVSSTAPLLTKQLSHDLKHHFFAMLFTCSASFRLIHCIAWSVVALMLCFCKLCRLHWSHLVNNNFAVQWVTLLLLIREVALSSLVLETGYPNSGLPESLQINSGEVSNLNHSWSFHVLSSYVWRH